MGELIVPGNEPEPGAEWSGYSAGKIDFIYDDVRRRFADAMRKHVLAGKGFRVDAQPSLGPAPGGLRCFLILTLSGPSPIVGERILGSNVIDALEPRDDQLEHHAADLWGQYQDARSQILADEMRKSV